MKDMFNIVRNRIMDPACAALFAFIFAISLKLSSSNNQ